MHTTISLLVDMLRISKSGCGPLVVHKNLKSSCRSLQASHSCPAPSTSFMKIVIISSPSSSAAAVWWPIAASGRHPKIADPTFFPPARPIRQEWRDADSNGGTLQQWRWHYNTRWSRNGWGWRPTGRSRQEFL